MMSDNPSENGAESAAQAATESMQHGADTAAATAKQATSETADRLQEANAQAGEMSQAASQAAGQAFKDARSRLEGVAASDPSNPMLEPFKFGASMLGGLGTPDLSAASDAVTTFNAKALEAWRTNAEAALAHWQSLVGVRSLSEAITLNSEFTRKQLEQMNQQSRDLMSLATKMTRGK